MTAKCPITAATSREALNVSKYFPEISCHTLENSSNSNSTCFSNNFENNTACIATVNQISSNLNYMQCTSPPNLTNKVMAPANEEIITNKIRILSWNIQGIGSKLEIEGIKQLIAPFDVVFLFETMKLDTFNPSLSDFQFHHCQRKYQHPRARRPSGGIGVLIKNSIKHLVKIEKMNEHVIWLSIKQKYQPPLIIGGTYVPPAGSKMYLNYEINDIFLALQTDITNFLSLTSAVALCGDFNGRTGGLSDIAENLTGKDADLISNLNLKNFTTTSQNEQNWDWFNKERQTKDTVYNTFGNDLVQMCKNTNMRILNGFHNESNTDNFTCHAPLGKSTVDYLISTLKFYEVMSDFALSSKIVESDHVPLTFTVAYESVSLKAATQRTNKQSDQKRFQYIFDINKVPQYREMLNSDVVQDKLIDQTTNSVTNIDSLIKSTYNCIESCIQTTFRKKQFKSARNTFPKNAWYDHECKAARKRANEYAKTHDLNIEANNLEYKLLHKQYKSTIQRKKRQHQEANRNELNSLQTTNQSECWKLWNKLTNTQTKTPNLPDIDTFHEYFTKQIHPPACDHFDMASMAEIDKEIDLVLSGTPINEFPQTISISICDSRITESEVALHLKKLKNNKAAGIDAIAGEFYKYAANELTVPLCNIFNTIFDKGEYPTQWAEGLINALHKKGDPSNPDNYRKITITAAMAKIFDSILNARLYHKNDILTLDDPFQFGFTPNRGTTDCVFVLDTIINNQQIKKKPLFLCFVDFTKAFDYINRNALYYKLHKQQMGLKMLKIIVSMFEKAQAKVHQMGNLSAPIDSVFGVLQGGILSPKLFNEFLSDIPKYLKAADGLEIAGTIFTHLLYADDIVLISESAKGLQNSIDSLHSFCAKWHLIVNTAKTKVMQIGPKNATNFLYNNQNIENVETFKYLGHTITSHKHIHKKMPEYIATQSQKALFALYGRMKPSMGHLPPPLAIKMFDSYVLPILEYNNIFWSGTVEIPKIEKVQISFLKHILNVRRQTPTLALYAETGRFPLKVRQQLAIINYWARLKNLPNDDILNICLRIQENHHSSGQNNWYSKIDKIMTDVNMVDWKTANPNSVIKNVKIKLYQSEQTKILDGICNTDKLPKLRTYKLFKTTFCLEPYLNLNLPKKMYSNIARFRISSHNLKIETGRHNIPKTPIEERKCDKCNNGEVENEVHCLLICSSNTSARTELLNKVRSLINNFDSLSNTEKFIVLMSDKRPEVIKAIGSFLNKVI